MNFVINVPLVKEQYTAVNHCINPDIPFSFTNKINYDILLKLVIIIGIIHKHYYGNLNLVSDNDM